MPFEDEHLAVRLKFIDALDAWIKVEHELGKLFYVLLKPIDFGLAHSISNGMNGFQAQREIVRTVAHERISQQQSVVELIDKLMDRGRSLATKRNYLVHGRWRNRNLRMRKPEALAHVYFPTDMRPFTQPGATIFELKGKYAYFLDDLVRCKDEFTALAHDLLSAQILAAKALKVSPKIELTDDDGLEFQELTPTPKGGDADEIS